MMLAMRSEFVKMVSLSKMLSFLAISRAVVLLSRKMDWPFEMNWMALPASCSFSSW